MNFKWFQNKLTFVIIPEANESVVRVKLSRGALWGAAAALLLLVSTSCSIYLHHMHTAAASYLQRTALHGKTAKLEQDLLSKNAAIEQLQNEIFELSKQAAEVHNKMEEIKRLEQDLQKLTAGAVGSSGSAVETEAPVTSSIAAFHGLGGPESPVTTAEIREFASATGARYTALQTEMNELQNRFSTSKKLLQEKLERQRRTPNIWPTHSRIVTSPYGYRKDPFTKKLSFHRGIDIAGRLGDPVYAAAGGIVDSVGYDKLHGHNIIVEHAQGLRTWYMHLNSSDVRKGEPVDKGQPIGKLGTTGRSTGPHLHYEVLMGGKSSDPAPYLPSSS
ncbi:MULTISPECIES: M23 family metallopeptidase [unclassified Paenibacillus]|uniref:M23 family metallopeptidase n=1 Tax=unclassified Paenibacillus TaxID=185978 RepID=UPI001AE2AB4E|nr:MULTISPECIES: M23 family metallopeptidase [unclassified Paenibacillus]MBP1153832.1 murein DD-endopeptidase MepM/ murein hydrolase activator NlpD [Paenibacillus sp. PvP091]MBP1170783.1 murein DD-endopeptidase MepM/ murein hydrolase activator NlpD [Paenibacillus sp. PvR098]MBP2441811.1 murein DD-endopeptidase MepM/ murein hydrolase activator NlpD [Paenibacillus sp. PvP052]